MIISELEKRPLRKNRYGKEAGLGRSQTFGVVNRRSLPADYSRMCWKRPYLYKLVLDFGRDFIKIPFNAVTLNQNYQCAPHRDKNNSGVSSIIAFGDFTGGSLQIHDGELEGIYSVKYR